MTESELYEPIKHFLEAQGYEVKGEIGACDVVGVREGEEPVVVELKKRLTLQLVLQAVDRLRVSDAVYLAFRLESRSRSWRRRKKRLVALLRRLGVGLLTVSPEGDVSAHLDPGPYRPRKSKRRRQRLLKEFIERAGDPEDGGSSARPRLTAYRQDAIRCASTLVDEEAVQVRVVREQTGVARAGRIMQDNHYGWFERVKRGHYTLTAKGQEELPEWRSRLQDVRGDTLV
jgi:hypothetical protein